MEHTSKVKRDLWRICNKIREAVNYIQFNFWEYFSIYDVKNTGFVTVFKFKNTLSGPLKSIINLNDEEIQLLVRYFEKSNDQVPYGHFCEIIHNEPNQSKINKELASKKKNDVTVNYTIQDLPRLNIMKTISSHLNISSIFLEPHFIDYEELTSNNGLMTITQFKDMLYALKIQISPPEMNLIIDKFIVYSYMIDKKQFLDELNWVKQNDPQSIFTEVTIRDKTKENSARLYSNKNVYHPVIANKTHKKDNVLTILRNLQKLVFENRIKIGQFFETFDPHRKGHVTETQFRRCLDMIGVSSLGSMYYPEAELSILLLMYKDKEFPERINWKQFEDEINTVFMERYSEKSLDIEVKCDRNVNEMLRIKGQDWEAVELNLRILFNKTIININNYLNENRIMVEQYFKVFDTNNHGHISRSDFRRAIHIAGIKCTEDELSILEKKFMNVDGFNYLQLLKMLIDIDKKLKKCSIRKTSHKIDNDKTSSKSIKKISNNMTLNKLMIKIKTTVKRGRVNIVQFLNQFDYSNHKVMSIDALQRGLDMAGVKLDSNELEILKNEFESKTHPGQVDYHRLCNMVEEAFVTLGLAQNTGLDPNEYLTSYEGLSNYLTVEQRGAVDNALKKLRSKPNIGLDDLFKDYDKFFQGVVSKQEFLCALTVRKLNMLLSKNEVKCLAEAFSKDERPNSFNYRAFMKNIDG